MTDTTVSDDTVSIRPGADADRGALAALLAAVAEEDMLGVEPPVDLATVAATWRLTGTLVAVSADAIVGELRVDARPSGFGEIGMIVASEWRGRGVGSALIEAAIEWARANGLHKLTLTVFPDNERAIALYEKFGFLEEGRHPKQVRRRSGELRDVIDMGLLL